MIEFTAEQINELVTKNNWEIADSYNGLYHLRQKDKHYMKTLDFELPNEIADKLDQLNSEEK